MPPHEPAIENPATRQALRRFRLKTFLTLQVFSLIVPLMLVGLVAVGWLRESSLDSNGVLVAGVVQPSGSPSSADFVVSYTFDGVERTATFARSEDVPAPGGEVDVLVDSTKPTVAARPDHRDSKLPLAGLLSLAVAPLAVIGPQIIAVRKTKAVRRMFESAAWVEVQGELTIHSSAIPRESSGVFRARFPDGSSVARYLGSPDVSRRKRRRIEQCNGEFWGLDDDRRTIYSAPGGRLLFGTATESLPKGRAASSF